MKAVVAAFNQEKALVGAFSVITNLRMELFEALVLVLVLVTPPDPGHDPRTESQNSLPNKSRHLTVSWTALTHRENEPGGLSHSVKLQEYNSPAILSYWPGATSDSASIRICDRFTLCKLFFLGLKDKKIAKRCLTFQPPANIHRPRTHWSNGSCSWTYTLFLG